MTDAVTKDTVFRPALSKAQSKAEMTDTTARAIIKAETDERTAKTERLRQARLEMEAQQPPPTKGRRVAKNAKTRASRRAV